MISSKAAFKQPKGTKQTKYIFQPPWLAQKFEKKTILIMDKRNNQNPYLVNLLDYYKSKLGVAIGDDDASNAIAAYLHITKAQFFSRNFPNPKEDKHKAGTIQAPFSWETMKLLTLGFNFPLNYFILTERDLDAFLASKILDYVRNNPPSVIHKNDISSITKSRSEVVYNRLELTLKSLANKNKESKSDIDGNSEGINLLQTEETQNAIVQNSTNRGAVHLEPKTFITEEAFINIFKDLLRFHNTHNNVEDKVDQENVSQLAKVIDKEDFLKELYSPLDKDYCLLRHENDVRNRIFTKHSPVNRLQFHLLDDFDKETFVDRYEKIMVEFVANAKTRICVYSYLGKGTYREMQSEIPLYLKAHYKVFEEVENILENSENPKIEYARFLALPNEGRIWGIEVFEEIVKKIGIEIDKPSMGNMSDAINAIIECSIPEFMHICNIILNEKIKGEVRIVYKPTFIHHYAVIDSKYALTEIYRYKSNRAFVPELLFLINAENEKEAVRGLLGSYEKDIDKLSKSVRSLLISRKKLIPLISSAYKVLREYIDKLNNTILSSNVLLIEEDEKMGRLNRKMNDMKEKLKEFNERYKNKLDMDIVNEL